jgi:Coenzyme PQQ synthesis protein D (PqqD)
VAADGILLLDLASGEYPGLNATDSLLWSLIDGGRGLAEIAVELRRRTRRSAGNGKAQVAQGLEALLQRGLVLG